MTTIQMVSVWTGRGPIMMLKNDFVAFSDLDVKLMQWYHLCFTYDYTNGLFKMYLDGELLDEGTHSRNMTELKGSLVQ